MQLLKRWADRSLAAENERLTERIAELDSRVRLQSLELDELTAVVARNIKRVEAETAAASQVIGGVEHHARNLSL